MKLATLTHFYEEPDDKALGVFRVHAIDDAIFTIEPGIADPRGKRVPDGSYYAKRIVSPNFGPTWTLIGVNDGVRVSDAEESWSDRALIRFHSGNDDEESLGCILTGLGITWDPRDMEPQVSSSRDAMAKLQRWIGDEDFLLEVTSGPISGVA